MPVLLCGGVQCYHSLAGTIQLLHFLLSFTIIMITFKHLSSHHILSNDHVLWDFDRASSHGTGV